LSVCNTPVNTLRNHVKVTWEQPFETKETTYATVLRDLEDLGHEMALQVAAEAFHHVSSTLRVCENYIALLLLAEVAARARAAWESEEDGSALARRQKNPAQNWRSLTLVEVIECFFLVPPTDELCQATGITEKSWLQRQAANGAEGRRRKTAGVNLCWLSMLFLLFLLILANNNLVAAFGIGAFASLQHRDWVTTSGLRTVSTSALLRNLVYNFNTCYELKTKFTAVMATAAVEELTNLITKLLTINDVNIVEVLQNYISDAQAQFAEQNFCHQ
jgi:hypothetical protein